VREKPICREKEGGKAEDPFRAKRLWEKIPVPSLTKKKKQEKTPPLRRMSVGSLSLFNRKKGRDTMREGV